MYGKRNKMEETLVIGKEIDFASKHLMLYNREICHLLLNG